MLVQNLFGAYLIVCILLILAGALLYWFRVILNVTGARLTTRVQFWKELAIALICAALIILLAAIIYRAGSA